MKLCALTHTERTTFLARQNLPEDKGCVYTDTFFPPAENTGRSFVNAQLGVFESASKAQHFFFLQLWCFGCYDTEYSWEKCIASSVVFKLWGALYWWDTDNQWKSMTWNQCEWLWFLSLVVILNLTGTSTVNKMFFQAINFISVLVVWAISFGKDTNAWIAAELNSALLFFSTWLVFHLVSSYTVIGWLGKQQPHCWHSW